MSAIEQTPPRPSMKERQRQMREDAILDAVLEFLQSKGFSAMTLDDITDSIGISRPTLYQHFCSKEEMVVHVAMRNLRRAVAKLTQLDRLGSPLERMVEFLDWALENRFGSCRSVFTEPGNLLQVAKQENPDYRDMIHEFRSRFSALVGEAQAAGEVRCDIRPELLVETIMSVYKSPGFEELMQQGITDRAEVRECIIKLVKAPGQAK